MIFEAVAGVIMIALAFLLMGFYSNHEYLKVFYLIISLILTSLGSSIIYTEGTAFIASTVLQPLVLIGTWGLSFVITLMLIKLIIDIFSSKIIPYINVKRGIEI